MIGPHRTLLERSIIDTYRMIEDINENTDDVNVGPEFPVGDAAILLYQFRVNEYHRKRHMEQQHSVPKDDGRGLQ